MNSNKPIRFHSFTTEKTYPIPLEMLCRMKFPASVKPTQPAISPITSQTKRTVIPINDFSVFDMPLEVCMGIGCNKKPTYMYYSSSNSNIMACEEHKRGPMHKISETRCYSYCEYKPVYFEKTDPTKKPKYCEFHVETLLSGGFSKKGIIDFMGLASNPPLTLDEYEVLF